MTPHMMAEWREDGIYFWTSLRVDRAWSEFLDVLTGQASSCPTLDELQMESEMTEAEADNDELILQIIQDIINQGKEPADALELIKKLLIGPEETER